MTVFPKSRLFPQPAKQTLTVIVHREPGRSPSYWLGPDLAANENFNIHVAFPPLWGPANSPLPPTRSAAILQLVMLIALKRKSLKTPAGRASEVFVG